MTKAVYYYPLFSIGYGNVGIASGRNLSQIIMLRFPDYPSLSARRHPRVSLTKEF
jgi:hypothetical protein